MRTPTNAAGALLALIAATSVDAQRPRTDAPPAQAQCAAALDTVRSGVLSDLESQYRNIDIVARCPAQRDSGLAMAWRRRSVELPSEHLEWAFSANIIGSQTRVAAIELAEDPGASVAVRALSLGALVRYLRPNATFTYSELTQGALGTACAPQGSPTPESLAQVTSTLDAAFFEVVRAVAMRLERATNVPMPVRSAANCLANTWRHIFGLEPTVIADVNLQAVSVVGACGTIFRLRNANAAAIVLTVGDGASQVRRQVRLAGRPSGAQYSELLYNSKQPGSGLLLYDGQSVVASASVPTSACTSPVGSP